VNQTFHENKVVGSIWFLLSFIVFICACLILTTEGQPLVFGILGMSLILFVIGRQRFSKFQLIESKFKKIIFALSLFTAMASSLSVIFISS
jgi:hypothetical protein